jgi:hypothetical protein
MGKGMSNLIEHGSNEPEIAHIESTAETPLSLKHYQDIYHQITGKTEEIRKRYKDSFRIELCDIEQLHTKINQILDIHNVVASNCSFTIYHEKDRKEQFTSFDKFRAFNSNSTSPILNVVLQYNASIIPARLQKPQEYNIAIRLSSRVAQLKQLKEDAPSFMYGALSAMVTSETAEIKVGYADYVIARGFTEAFDEWMSGTKKTKESKTVKSLQKYSHHIPPVGKIAISSMYGFFIFTAIDPILGINPELNIFAKYLILSSVTFVLALSLSEVSFKAIERSIDSITDHSWIKLNKGDEEAIEDASSSTTKSLVRLLVSGLGIITLGIVSSQLSNFIDKIL